VVQLASEAEGGGQRAALGQPEGAEAEARGGEGRAGVVQRLADGAEGVGLLLKLRHAPQPDGAVSAGRCQ
jgi:hypothetical protein